MRPCDFFFLFFLLRSSSMIKCRQGAAAAGPKFIIVLGRMSAECESEGGLQEGGEEEKREEREEKESQIDAARGMRNLGRSLSSQTTAEFSGAWQLHTCVIPQNQRARDSPMKRPGKRRGAIRGW